MSENLRFSLIGPLAGNSSTVRAERRRPGLAALLTFPGFGFSE